jgi:hypothetical protein
MHGERAELRRGIGTEMEGIDMSGEHRKRLQVAIKDLRAKLEAHSVAYPVNGNASALNDWRAGFDGLAADIGRLLSAYNGQRSIADRAVARN